MRHDFRRVCLTNLHSNCPMMIINQQLKSSTSRSLIRACHLESTSLTGGARWSAETGYVTAPLLRCAAEQSGGAVWSIEDENSLQCNHKDEQGGRWTHSHIPYCKYNLNSLYSFSVLEYGCHVHPHAVFAANFYV